MAFNLPINEQKQLISDIRTHLSSTLESDFHPYSWDELRAEVREAEEQIASGRYYSSEEDDRLFDEFISKELNVAL